MSARTQRTLTKAAGIDGLGQIPRDWDAVALRHLLEFENGQADPRVEPYASGLLIAPNHIESGTGRLLGVESAREQGAISGKYRVRAGDIVYSKIRPALRKVAISNCDCLCSADMYALRPFDRGDSRFFFWSLLSDYFSKTVVLDSERVAMPKVNRESLGAVRLLRPPVEEQRQIAWFLDYETARIDALIEKQQELIALLKEKRQAVISHAVTKGLYPDAPLRDSGVEWLGKVPAHWVVSRIKHMAEMDSGHTPSRTVEDFWIDCKIPWVSLNDTKQMKTADYLHQTAVYINEKGMANSSAHLLPARSVVFTRDATIGLAAIIATSMAVSQHIIAWICDPQKVTPEYLLLVFYAMQTELERYTFGATLKTIGMHDVSKLTAAFPPVEEQNEIARYVFQAKDMFASSIAKAEEMLVLLQERRTALISAAVTGKIDVRGWAPPESRWSKTSHDERRH